MDTDQKWPAERKYTLTDQCGKPSSSQRSFPPSASVSIRVHPWLNGIVPFLFSWLRCVSWEQPLSSKLVAHHFSSSSLLLRPGFTL